MQNFVRRENLWRFRKLLAKTTDETVRSQLFKLIAEEERRQLQRLDWLPPLTRKSLNHPATIHYEIGDGITPGPSSLCRFR